MGRIICSKKEENSVLLVIQVDYAEFLHLSGHYEDVHLFTPHCSSIQTNISQRGKNEATKYFLIPRQFRKDLHFRNVTSCQRIDFTNNVFFVYCVDKNKLNPSKRDLALKRLEEKYKP